VYGVYALYLQDAFKASSKLTINAGLRWDIQVPYSTNNDEQDFVTSASLKVPNPAASGQQGVLTRYGGCTGCAGVHRASIHWGEVGPRLGFSYALNHETVLSGGFSTLWQQYTNNNGNFENDGNAFGAGNYITSNGTNQPAFGNWDSQKLAFPPLAQFSPAALAGNRAVASAGSTPSLLTTLRPIFNTICMPISQMFPMS
jgi:outer membrane receptor protein involved in Fe transport